VNAQAGWILANPWTYLKLMITRIADLSLYSGMIATLGWGTIFVAPAIYWIYWIALLATAVLDGNHENVRLPVSKRAISVGVYFLVMAAIATLTYLAWQAVGEDQIHGVQSRYFIPMLPLLLLCLRSPARVASCRFARWCVPAMAMVVVMIGVAGTWQAMIARHYWY
jgi:uncharacterized membrane protein